MCLSVFEPLLTTNISELPPPPIPDTDTLDSEHELLVNKQAPNPDIATEMLTESVHNLKVADDAKDDFRIKASKIINNMLVSRLNNQALRSANAAVNQPSTKEALGDRANEICTNLTNNKSLLASNDEVSGLSSNSSSGNSSCSASDRSLSPPSPSAMPNKTDIVSNMPSVALATASIPPLVPAMPAACLTNNENSESSITTSCQQKTHTPHTTDTITDMHHTISDKNIVGTVGHRNGVPAGKPSVTFAHNLTQTHLHPEHQQRNDVAFRNKSPAELTAHARDRRSFADQGITTNAHNQKRNSQVYADQANSIAAKLQDGELPLCCVCHVKIDR